AAAHLEPADVLVDRMRGSSSLWTRIRVNLEHVPARLRPKQEALDPDAEPGGKKAADKKKKAKAAVSGGP
ncbi:MAG: ATP-dependent ligase, partial [Ramlibacter sp.]|nr:ATP-dependent ligase [Ramlibacter sp.]